MAEFKCSYDDASRTGVYSIRNRINGKRYVGSASRSFRTRWGYHLKDLRANKHRNRHLQSSWRKYGEDVFEFEILEVCEPDDCVSREQVFMDAMEVTCDVHGYNIAPIAGSCRGIIRKKGRIVSEETRRKMSEALKGRNPTEEQLRKLSAAIKGVKRKPFTAETKAKMAASQRGKKASPEARQNMANAQRGHKQSSETIEKRLAQTRGQKRTPEQRERMRDSRAKQSLSPEHLEAFFASRDARKGRPLSAEHREKVSKAMTGKKKSPESIAKREATRRRNRELRDMNLLSGVCSNG